jgi:hypothetical protein
VQASSADDHTLFNERIATTVPHMGARRFAQQVAQGCEDFARKFCAG